MNRFLTILLAAAVTQASLPPARGDTFGSGANSFEIEFVTIGNPSNPPDTTDRPVTDGAVAYSYHIGKYEISEQMIDKANSESAAAGAPLNITHDGRRPNMPATSISWFEAARYVNWLNSSTGNMPAYKFDSAGNFQLWEPDDPGYDPQNLYRNRLAFYFLPTISEWHKAAYYDPSAGTYYDYPTGSNSVPDGIDFVGDPAFDAVFFDGGLNGAPLEITNVGLASPYGTFGQGGNVSDWLESAFDRINNEQLEGRQRRGGSWDFSASLLTASNEGIGVLPTAQFNWIGFRVTSVVPEPSTVLLLSLGLFGICPQRRRMMAK